MQVSFRLREPLSRAHSVDPKDVIRTKAALKALGYYKEPEDGLNPIADGSLFRSIEAFQSDHGLREDGEINPEGPTIERLKRELQREPAELDGRSKVQRARSQRTPRNNDSLAASSTSPTEGNKKPERSARRSQQAAVPAIAVKVAEFLGMSAVAAWAWWQSLDKDSRVSLAEQINKSGALFDSDDEEVDCDHIYYNVDIPTCRAVSRNRGKTAGARCYASASERYAACLRGRRLDELPPLDVWNN